MDSIKEKEELSLNCSNNLGFSLVELMICVAIIGIIAAIAIPTYNGYIETGRQAKAEAELMQLPILLEQYRAEDMAGNLCPGGNCNGNSYTDQIIKAGYLTSFFPNTSLPYTEDNITYSFNITFTSDTEATLTATLTIGGANQLYTCSFPEGTCP